MKTSQNSKVKYLTTTAVFAALIALMTAYILHIPTANGYIHIGDSLIYLAVCILPRPYAMVAAALGGGIADLLTAPVWVLPTMIIKPLITIPFINKGDKIICLRNIIAPVLAYFISTAGYYVAELIMFGNEKVAFLSSIASNFLQSFGSAVVFYLFAFALDKIHFKSRLFS